MGHCRVFFLMRKKKNRYNKTTTLFLNTMTGIGGKNCEGRGNTYYIKRPSPPPPLPLSVLCFYVCVMFNFGLFIFDPPRQSINMAVPLAIGATAIVVLYAGRRYFQGPKCHSTKRLEGKTVVITGGNTGIGKETAVDLAKRGAKVIVGCRNLEKGKEALKEIQERSGSTNVYLEHLDLASLDSVRTFADSILKSESRLDILINNAGVMMCPYQKTKDGFEIKFGTNHLGHFLLTMLLLDRLKKSAPSRIVNVSSIGHSLGSGKIHFDDINFEKDYSPYEAYFHSKLANVLFTRELSKRLEGSHVTANSLHPGAVRTDLERHFTFLQTLMVPARWYMYKSPEQGAQTSIYCAVSEEMEGVSGKYLADCAIKEPSKGAQDDDAAMKLWELSLKLVGLEK